MAKNKRVVFSFDERSLESLEKLTQQGRFSSMADTVRESLQISRALQSQAGQGSRRCWSETRKPTKSEYWSSPHFRRAGPNRRNRSHEHGRKDEAKPEDLPIEAGEVGELHDLSFHEAKHRAETAKTLARWLVIILGASIALHYILTVILAFGGKEEATKSLNSIFLTLPDCRLAVSEAHQ